MGFFEVIPQEGPSMDEQIFVLALDHIAAADKVVGFTGCLLFKVRGTLEIAAGYDGKCHFEDSIFKVNHKVSWREVKISPRNKAELCISAKNVSTD